MDIFEQLRHIATEQNLAGDLPSWLLADILVIADNPHRYRHAIPLVETLAEQVQEYDPFAGMGCLNASSIGVETIRSTIRQIKLH